MTRDVLVNVYLIIANFLTVNLTFSLVMFN